MSGQRHIISTPTLEAAAAAGVTDTKSWKCPPSTVFPSLYLESLQLVPDDAIAANDTDYVTVALSNATASVTLDSRNTKVTGGAAFVAGTAIIVDLTALTVAQRKIAPGDVITGTITGTGAGKAASFRWIMGLSEIGA